VAYSWAADFAKNSRETLREMKPVLDNLKER
jgi:hypothetical protein